MTEFGESAQSPLHELAQTLAGIGIGVIRERDYIGRKVARDFMDETGLSGALDDVGDAALTDMMGTCVTGGIVLGMKKKTDEASIAEEVQRLSSQLPDGMSPVFTRLIAVLVPRGIEFYASDLSQNSPKVQEWTREFRLLISSES